MQGNKLTVFISALTLLLVFAVMCSFQLNKDEKGILTTFGKPQVIEKPGLYFRWPWPIQKLIRLDVRKQLYEGKGREIPTKDNVTLIVKVMVNWSVDEENPLEFYKKVGSLTSDADSQLESLVKSTQEQVIRSYSQADFFTSDQGVSRLEQIEEKMAGALNEITRSQYGIVVHNVAFVRNSLHEKNSISVLARMKQEQEKRAVGIRSQAEKEAQIKRNKADEAKAKTLAKAEAEAKKIRDEVQVKASELFAQYENDQEFAAFLRKLDAIKEIMKTTTTGFFNTNIAPFDLFKSTTTKEAGKTK